MMARNAPDFINGYSYPRWKDTIERIGGRRARDLATYSEWESGDSPRLVVEAQQEDAREV